MVGVSGTGEVEGTDHTGPTSATRRAVHRPTRFGAVIAVAAGALAVGLVASDGPQLRALAVELVGLVVVAVGVEFRHRGHRLDGAVIALVGGAVAAGGLVAGVTDVPSLSGRVELLPGMVGLALLVAGVSGLRSGWERHFVTAGTGLILTGAAGSGVVLGTGPLELLASVVATVVAWDVAEQSINLGEQVGRAAETRRVEVLHGLGGVGVGAVGVGLAVVIDRAAVSGVPLAALAALLVAGVILMLVLYN